MSNLLRKLTDDEIEKTYATGGNNCSYYRMMLPGYVAACAIAVSQGGTCGCSEMKWVQNYLAKNC